MELLGKALKIANYMRFMFLWQILEEKTGSKLCYIKIYTSRYQITLLATLPRIEDKRHFLPFSSGYIYQWKPESSDEYRWHFKLMPNDGIFSGDGIGCESKLGSVSKPAGHLNSHHFLKVPQSWNIIVGFERHNLAKSGEKVHNHSLSKEDIISVENISWKKLRCANLRKCCNVNWKQISGRSFPKRVRICKICILPSRNSRQRQDNVEKHEDRCFLKRQGCFWIWVIDENHW